MSTRPALAAIVSLVLSACGGPGGPSSPAADGVRAYVHALKANDPASAYKLLSADTRKKLSYDEFALQWKQSEQERTGLCSR